MAKKIVVAGAGHGGLPAASRLARAGFDVTVYEKKSEGTLGYDWTDIFSKNAFGIAGLNDPPKDEYEPKEDMTFYGPSCTHSLRQNIPVEKREIKMERRDIYKHLIRQAEECGVKLVYDCAVEGPIMCGDRVVGIKTSAGEVFADLVIDAAGVDSPVRTRLPAMCGITKSVSGSEALELYRAFYNRTCPLEDTKDLYKVYIFPEKKRGIAWVSTEPEYTDLLVSRFGPLSEEEALRQAEELRRDNPSLGETVLRGGQINKIPVRHPLSVMVCDGYAAIGDSAFMTVPLIGSGITNCLKASQMLAETILADKNEAFSAETLWNYQVRYYSEIGSRLVPLACAKKLLMKIDPEDVDYVLGSGLLSSDNLKLGSDKSSLSSLLGGSPSDMLDKIKVLSGNKPLIKKLLKTVGDITAASALTAAMPKKYSKPSVTAWAGRYDSLFEKM